MYVHTISYGTACKCGIYLYLSCITYIVFGVDVRPHLQKKLTSIFVASKGCPMQSRFPKLQQQRDKKKIGQGRDIEERYTT
jgi:hypothetical protein